MTELEALRKVAEAANTLWGAVSIYLEDGTEIDRKNMQRNQEALGERLVNLTLSPAAQGGTTKQFEGGLSSESLVPRPLPQNRENSLEGGESSKRLPRQDHPQGHPPAQRAEGTGSKPINIPFGSDGGSTDAAQRAERGEG